MSFQVAPTAYDRFMGRYSRPLAVEFADWLGVTAGQRALDVGSGPGALTEVLADRLGSASVVAVDPSELFVAAIRERLPGVTAIHAAAEQLPLADESFDIVAAQLVVQFMTDPLAGVSELRRVTRPGGVVALNVWDFEGARSPLSAFLRALKGLEPATDDESDRTGARRGQLGVLLRDAGCRDVDESELSVTVTSPTFQDWWEPYTLGVGPAGSQLAALSPDRRLEVRERCRAALGDGPIHTSATAWVARGVR
jgi:trans-aconitate methyltransferase